MNEFTKQLTTLINKESLDNLTNTPDFILAKFLHDIIMAWKDATIQRDSFFNRNKN